MHDKLSTSEANVSPVAWSESAWLHNRLRLRKVQAAIKRFSNTAAYRETACALREYKCLANSDNVQWRVKANHCVVDQHNGGFLSCEILLRALPKQCWWAACICVQISVPERWKILIYVCTNMSSYAQGAINHRCINFQSLARHCKVFRLHPAQCSWRSTTFLITSVCKLMNCWTKGCSWDIVA